MQGWTKGDRCCTNHHHSLTYRCPGHHAIKKSNGEMGSKNHTTPAQASHPQEHSGHIPGNDRHWTTWTNTIPVWPPALHPYTCTAGVATNNVHSNSDRCMTKSCNATGDKHSHQSGTSVDEHHSHAPQVDEELCNVYADQIWTFFQPHGTPRYWQNNLKLQEVNAWPGSSRGVANCIW